MIDEKLLKLYSKEKIEEGIRLFTYKHVDPLPKEESTNFPVMYVFRHGQTTDNADFIYSGWRDVDITEEGVKQALILSEKLKNKKIQMLISSDQIRAIKTMQIAMSGNNFATNLEIIKDKRIKERSYGDLQGQSKLKTFLENPELLAKQRRNYYYVPPNGESLEIVTKRVMNFLNEIIPKIIQTKLNVAISCHGNSIRSIRQYFEHLTNDQTAAIETPLGQDYAAYVIN